MQVQITGLIADSAGIRENGRIEFAQAQRINTGELLVTQSLAIAQVVNGALRTLAGGAFKLPVNPDGTAVRVREILGGRTFEWWTAVPEVDSIEYRLLEPMESASVPESIWGPPTWLAEVLSARDETIAKIDEGKEIADTLGGLSGIDAAVADAAAASALATAEATRSHDEADRAEAAANSVDMGAITDRLDGVDGVLGLKADLVDGHVPGSQLPIAQTATAGTIPERATGGRLPGIGLPTVASDAATKAYIDDAVAAMASGLASDLAAFQAQVLLIQDQMTTVRIDQSSSGAGAVTAQEEYLLMYAPFPIEITGVTLVLDGLVNISGTTNSMNIRIVRRANSGATAIDVVSLNTNQQAVGGSTASDRRKPWSMAAGNWGAVTNRRLAAGQSLSLVFGSIVGSPSWTMPMIAQIEWRPVR